MQYNPGLFVGALVASILTTFLFGFLGLLFPGMTKIFGSLYCLGQGSLIGVVSLAFEIEAPGIVMTALLSVVMVLRSRQRSFDQNRQGQRQIHAIFDDFRNFDDCEHYPDQNH